jgi:hypothetical protein
MNTDIDPADLDEVLRRAYPQGYALLRCENGITLLHHGARQLIGSPKLALEVLGSKATAKLGRAVVALGQQRVAEGEGLLDVAGEKLSGENKDAS